MAKKTIFKLQFETDFRIVGLFCSERDYRLSWLINRQFLFNLKRTSDFEYLPVKSNESGFFSVFFYYDESCRREYYLVSNRSGSGSTVFTTPPGLDYLLLIKIDDDRFDANSLLTGLRAIPQLSAAYALDDLLAKTKEPFLYDFEMFVLQQIEAPRRKEDLKWV